MNSGYTPCACRDCFDETISADMSKPELCSACFEAGCAHYTAGKPSLYRNSYECQRDDAYGCGDGESITARDERRSGC